MRWTTKKVLIPTYGQTRIVRRFLWLPETLDGQTCYRLTRWLEFAEVSQEFRPSGGGDYWGDHSWLDI